MRTALTACVVIALYLGTGVFDHEIWSPTEPQVSGIVWNMLEHGELAVPRINDIPYLDKPPLYYWLGWASASASGRLTPGFVRLPAALLGVGALALVYWIARRRHGESVACIAVLLGATCGPFYEIAHRASTDIAAVFFAFLCWALYARSLDTREGSAWRWELAFAVALAVSFYAKNLYTFLVVLPPVALSLLERRRPGRLVAIGALTAGLAAALAVPWALALHEAGGDLLVRVAFYDNTLGRFLTIEGHESLEQIPLNDAFTAEKGESMFFYLPRVFNLPLPWILIFLVAAARLLRGWRELDAYGRFTVLGLFAVPLALTLSSSKATEYLLPTSFFVLAILAELLGALATGRSPLSTWERRLVVANLAVVGAAAALFPIPLVLERGQSVLLLLLPTGLVATWLLWRWRTGQRGADSLLAYGAAVALAATTALALTIPIVDAHKSFAPFFDRVRRKAEGRPVLTTQLSDRRLSLMNFYLRRRVEVVPLDAALDALSRPEPVGVLVHRREYEQKSVRERLDALPRKRVEVNTGRGKLVYVGNG